MNASAFLNAYGQMPRGYTYSVHDGIGIFLFPAFAASGLIRHGFTARVGGVSQGPYASLNMSFTREKDGRENILENHRRFAAAAGIAYDSMVMDCFEHGITVLEVNRTHCGMGYICPPLPPCDGLVTTDPGVTLITGHADCVPLYLLDTARQCIGLAHAGWKGTLGKIGLHMARLMIERFQCTPETMLAGIGPCICKDCFEVGKDLAIQFADTYPEIPLVSPHNGGDMGKAQLDLTMASAAQYLEAGIPATHISIMDVCTYEDEERLYSYRRDGNTGGMAAYMQLCGDTDAFLAYPQRPQML